MAKTYEHRLKNGKPVVVRVPRGSTNEPMVIKENMIGVAAGAALRRLLRSK